MKRLTQLAAAALAASASFAHAASPPPYQEREQFDCTVHSKETPTREQAIFCFAKALEEACEELGASKCELVELEPGK